MELFYDPISTTSRPIMLFAAEAALDLDFVYVNLAAGEQLTETFSAINPNCAVPALRDGDFCLTECSAILKYLAEHSGSAAYPSELRDRARVNAVMDWFNTGFYRDAGYGLAYPVLLPTYRIGDAAAQAAIRTRAVAATERWLTILDQRIIGDQRYVCGNGRTIADHLGSAYVALLDLVAFDLAPYPNVASWMTRMRAHPHWIETYAAFDGMLSAIRSAFREAS